MNAGFVHNRCRQVLWLWVCGVATTALLMIAPSAAA
jgi:hypothetical protein